MSTSLHRLSAALSGSNVPDDLQTPDETSPALAELRARPDPTSPYYYNDLSSFSFSPLSSSRTSPISPAVEETCPFEASVDIPTSRRLSDQHIEKRRSINLNDNSDWDVATLHSPGGSVRKKSSHVSFSDFPASSHSQRPSLSSVNYSRPSRSSSEGTVFDSPPAGHRRTSSFARGFETLPFTQTIDDNEIFPIERDTEPEVDEEAEEAAAEFRRERDRRHSSFQRGFTQLPYEGDEIPSRPQSPEQRDNADRESRFSTACLKRQADQTLPRRFRRHDGSRLHSLQEP